MTDTLTLSLSHSLANLPAIVKAERVRRRVSLRTAGEAMGVSHADLHRFEAGLLDVRLSTLVKIARWLDGGAP